MCNMWCKMSSNYFAIGFIFLIAAQLSPAVSMPTAVTMKSMQAGRHHDHHGSGYMEEDQPEVVSCNERNQPVYERNPEDCSSYFVCSGFYYVLMECPEGLHYNNRSGQCDYPAGARCRIMSKNIEKTVFDY